MTPSMFESMQARELLSLKARMLVSDAVALTPAELTEAQALMLRQQESDPSKAAAAKERTIQDVLLQKQQRTLAAYAQSLKATLPISVRRELL
jgi:peptidyl-prolyl cis-trans isomerase D